jgi:hypothetical protein
VPEPSTPRAPRPDVDEPAEALAAKPATPSQPDASERAPTPSQLPEDAPILLLAANFPAELPSYAVHPSLGASGLEVIRMSAGLRSAGASPGLSVLAPEHRGLTQSAQPTLYWALDRPSKHAIEIVVNQADDLQPLLEKRIPAPVAAGIHSLDLAAEGVTLAEGRPYEWSVSMISNEKRRDADLVSLGVVQYLPSGEEASGEPSADSQARTVHRLAKSGYWYDALDQLERWLAAVPEQTRLREYRRALLSEVGLEPVIAWLAADASERPDEAAAP